jgi:uncharacterized protein (DUF2236 family)
MWQFRRHMGSTFSGLFGAAAFDEVALIPVAAAVDKTGRFEANFTDRGLRGGFSVLLALWGDAQDRTEEADRLKRLHREVKGRGTGEFSGVRYSALSPALWNWIAVSGLMVTMHSFTPCTGIVLTPAEREAAYQQLLESFRVLELPGDNAKLPPTYADAVRYYDAMVATELRANPFLKRATARLTKLPLPTLMFSARMRVALTPIWSLVRPVTGRVVKVCSFGIMHPGVRDLTGFKWRRRHDREFALYSRLLQLGWRTLPDRVLLVPIARNRLEYEKIVRKHRSVGLASFAPPGRRPGG